MAARWLTRIGRHLFAAALLLMVASAAAQALPEGEIERVAARVGAGLGVPA